MEQYITQEQVGNYLTLPQNFDWDLIDQETGFAKVFEIFPEEIYDLLKEDEDPIKKEIFKLLTKAGVYYSFILSIPKIKVHLSNYGIQEFTQDKVKSAPWWDIRDLGLSMLKIADKCLSSAITKTAKIESLKSEIPFFTQVSEYISTPEEFEKIYSINSSPEVFLMLQKFIKKAMLLMVSEKLKKDCIDVVKTNEDLLPFLKDALVFYSLHYAALLPGFVFTQNAVVIQYEELPWQKSLVLDSKAKISTGENFLQLANESMKIITDYIKNNLADFPCYQSPISDRILQSRESGIYL